MSGDLHTRFAAWLSDGARDDPPRDAAVHASGCATCIAGIAALDALGSIDLGTAPLPASRGRTPAAPARVALRTAVASAVVVIVALGTGMLGASLITAGRPLASPQQQVLAGTGAPVARSSPIPSETASPTPTGSPTPTAAPSATGILYVPPPAVVATPRPTRIATPSPSPTLVPSLPPPPDDCADGIDNDGDLLIDAADPGCTLNGDEASADPPPPDDCADGIDNDGDLLIDAADPGCTLNGDEASADPPPPPDDCADGIDNDGDLLIDAADPGCTLNGEEASA